MATQSRRGRAYGRPVARAQRAATSLHTSLYRATGGRLGGRLAGGPVLLLTTKGRKSGRERTVPLLYLPDGEDLVLVASNGGTAAHPMWLLNLRAQPAATVEVGEKSLRVRAREASPGEKERLWPRLVEMYGGYESYQQKTDRPIPVVILHPANDERPSGA
ncbi:nitroreductase family deazaflavin-dependent oxidoreductase [Rubrobacter marinus]|uniref:Nitroreductase family deazaflavin-dependent oxidoreductase n=1 Tax=Rubrobacter marinus TaxID=2653852 RepID=A0A6G8PZQ0_9ACTN|nr:nitroreductase family deazaflavin-dependent oxidoreductase [Rubrobacter marinus]QIN79703.1 nitroreductase family deazaflavin-dependent oxidoreductase [Rubrobacter marinus]